MQLLSSSTDGIQAANGSTRRDLLRVASAGLATLAFPGAALSQTTPKGVEVPASGSTDPKLVKFDELMSSFMREQKAPGAALAVTHGGRLVYARGFGYADVEGRQPVQPTSLFRIASISKTITSAAIFRLIDEGKLRLSDKVFSIVKLTPHLSPGKHVDPRIATITVRHCLQHTAGWDRSKGFDPMGANEAEAMAKALGISLPVSREDIIRYTLGRPLDFNPGTAYAYSNFGYIVLGRVIEAVSKASYEAFVLKEVLNPLGIKQMRLGKNFLSDRAPDEVIYYDSHRRTRRAFSGPQIGKEVPRPYEGGLEPMDANGGWIASAIDLVRFAAAFDDPSRCPILKAESIRAMLLRPEGALGHEKNGKPKAVYYASGWNVRPVEGKPGQMTKWHGGGLTGTESLMVCRSDKTNWAILFNGDTAPDDKYFAGIIDPLLHKATDETKNWPAGDLFPSFYPTR
jgi:CubicO group peptidase (beta-lactamase class C family)